MIASGPPQDPLSFVLEELRTFVWSDLTFHQLTNRGRELDISSAVLAQTLEELCQAGLIKRTVYRHHYGPERQKFLTEAKLIGIEGLTKYQETRYRLTNQGYELAQKLSRSLQKALSFSYQAV